MHRAGVVQTAVNVEKHPVVPLRVELGDFTQQRLEAWGCLSLARRHACGAVHDAVLQVGSIVVRAKERASQAVAQIRHAVCTAHHQVLETLAVAAFHKRVDCVGDVLALCHIWCVHVDVRIVSRRQEPGLDSAIVLRTRCRRRR